MDLLFYAERRLDESPATTLCWKPGSDTTLAVGRLCGEIDILDVRAVSRGERDVLRHKPHSRAVTKLAFAPHRFGS